jgi:membrane protein DedA with SNARE-associated domain
MLGENVFPPLPSELIMPFAGFVAARGELSPVLVVVAGSVGSLAGALPWYVAGRTLGCERLKRLADRHGRWLTIDRDEIDRGQRWLHRRGPWVLVVGRLVPALRTVVALPAGIAGLSLPVFLVWSALGALLWCALLTAAGVLLESQYGRIAKALEPVTIGIVVLVVAGYLLRVARHGKHP